MNKILKILFILLFFILIFKKDNYNYNYNKIEKDKIIWTGFNGGESGGGGYGNQF